RAITLDTGIVTFWQALDLFCRSADLAEGGQPPRPPDPAPGKADARRLPPGNARPKFPVRGSIGEAAPIEPPSLPAPIILQDRNAPPLPLDASSAVRVRVLNARQRTGAAAKDEFLLPIEIMPEQKLRWQQTVGVQVQRVIDEHGEKLTPGEVRVLDPAVQRA